MESKDKPIGRCLYCGKEIYKPPFTDHQWFECDRYCLEEWIKDVEIAMKHEIKA